MGNQNQGQDQDKNRQAQGSTGQKTSPQDPQLNPERDDDNGIQRRTSDEGQGRNQSASTKRSSASESDSDESTTGQAGGPKSNDADRSQSGTTRRDGNP